MGCASGAKVYGIGGELPGAQAEYVAVPAADANLVRIPSGMDDTTALVLTDNLPTGWVGAVRADFDPGDSVAVIGLGSVGQCAVRSAIAQGAARVFAIDPVKGRRDLAAQFGACAVEGPAVEAVLELTGGCGVAAAIDAVGRNAMIDDAIAASLCGRRPHPSIARYVRSGLSSSPAASLSTTSSPIGSGLKKQPRLMLWPLSVEMTA